MKTDIQIARECELKPIGEIASQMGIDPERIDPYGRFMAKVPAFSLTYVGFAYNSDVCKKNKSL